MQAQTDGQAQALPMNPGLQALFERLVREADAPESIEWDGTESELDAKVYGDPDIHRQEVERIFRRLPICLGFADQLREPGSMLARDLFGLPLLLVRDRQGDIQVLLNVCRHRGARLVAGEHEVCRHASLVCPYHAWSYDLNGELRGVPSPEGFPKLDRSQRGLRRLPSVVRHGMIWARMDPQASGLDVAAFLGEVDHDLDALDLRSHRFFRQRTQLRATNWKLVMDAFQETYHIRRLHRDTIAPFFTHAKSAGEGLGPHMRILVPRESFEQARGLPPSQWDLRKHVTLTHAIFPNTLIIYHPDFTSHLGMYPTGPGETLFVHTMFTPHEARSAKELAHWDRSFTLIDGGVFGAEDLAVSEQIQLGVNSGANKTFVFGRFEQHLRRFHQHAQAMREAP